MIEMSLSLIELDLTKISPKICLQWDMSRSVQQLGSAKDYVNICLGLGSNHNTKGTSICFQNAKSFFFYFSAKNHMVLPFIQIVTPD